MTGSATNELFLYVLTVAALRHNIQVHVACVLSNHFHLLVTDPDASLPAFMRYLDSLVARALNASLGRFESFWAGTTSYSAVAQGSSESAVAKAGYVLANPVAAGLVRHASEWPGVWTSPEQIGTKLTVRRPKGFFREDGYMPESVELALTAPPGFASPQEFQDRVGHELRDLEGRAVREIETSGRGFLGVARVRAQSPRARPTTGEPRFGLDPRIAARDKWKRIEALAQLKQFLEDYRAAWRELRSGNKTALFPPGTYLLRLMHGVQCVPAI